MFVYAGIDEAGYGPMLGPLCVACSAFIVRDHDPDLAGPCDLWKRLHKAVCRKKTDKLKRIAVDDSKNLKGQPDGKAHPLMRLERGVLAFHAAMTPAPAATDADLLKFLDVAVSAAPWYGSTTPLPVGQTADELRIPATRLKRVMDEEGVSFELLRCEAIDVEAFNRQVGMMGNKSSVNFCAVMRLIDAVWRRWPAEHPRVIVDRQGGRKHYLQDLLTAYPEAKIQILAESETLSRYRLEERGSQLTVSFMVEAEDAHLPVALASMTAKYVRELLMIRLNRYFQALMPELKPTAGYTEDARRYLLDIEPLLTRLGVDRTALIRRL